MDKTRLLELIEETTQILERDSSDVAYILYKLEEIRKEVKR